MLPQFISQNKLQELADESGISTDQIVKILKAKGHQIEGVNVIQDKPAYTKKALNAYQLKQVTKNQPDSAKTMTNLSSAGYKSDKPNGLLNWIDQKGKKIRSVAAAGLVSLPLSIPKAGLGILKTANQGYEALSPTRALGLDQGASPIGGYLDKATGALDSFQDKAINFLGMSDDAAQETEGVQKGGEFVGAALTSVGGLKALGGAAGILGRSPKVASFLSRNPKIASTLGFGGTSVASTGLANATMEGRLPDKEDLVIGALLDGFFLGGGKILGSLIPKNIKGKALKGGMLAKDVDEIAQLDKPMIEFAQKLKDQAEKNYATYTKTSEFVDSPYDLISKEKIDPLMSKINTIKSQVGEQIQSSTEALKSKGTVNMDAVENQLREIFKKGQVTIRPDNTLDIDQSSWRWIKSQFEPLEKLWKDIAPVRSADGQVTTASKSLRSVKADIDAINTVMEHAYRTGDFSVIERELQEVKNIYRTMLDTVDSPLGEAMRKYSDLADVTTSFTKLSGKEALTTPSIVKGLFPDRQVNPKSRDVFRKIMEQAQKYGIDGAGDLPQELALAKIADDVYQSAKQVEKTTDGRTPLTRTGMFAKAVDDVKEFFYGNAPEAMQVLLNALKEGKSLDNIPWYRGLPQDLKSVLRGMVQSETTSETMPQSQMPEQEDINTQEQPLLQ